MTEAYRQGFLSKCAEHGVPGHFAGKLLKMAGIDGQDYDSDSIKSFYNDIVLPTKFRNAGTPGVDYDPSNYTKDFFNNVNVNTVDKFNVNNFAGGATGQFVVDENGSVKGLTPGKQNIIMGRESFRDGASAMNRDFRQEMNSGLVHELSHAQNFDADMKGKSRGTSDAERELADNGYGFNDQNSTARRFYSNVTDENELRTRMQGEEIATNRQYRYLLYNALSKKLGRTPTVDEFTSYVRDIPAEDYAKFLVKERVNGYVDPSRWITRGKDGNLVYNHDNIEKTRQANMRLAGRYRRP